jgi:hypothetical protein
MSFFYFTRYFTFISLHLPSSFPYTFFYLTRYFTFISLHLPSIFSQHIFLFDAIFYVYFLAPSFHFSLHISFEQLQTLGHPERQLHLIVRPLQQILPHFSVVHTERRAVQLYVLTSIWLWSLKTALFSLLKHKLVRNVFAAAANGSSSHAVTFAQRENGTKRDFCFSVLIPMLLNVYRCTACLFRSVACTAEGSISL